MTLAGTPLKGDRHFLYVEPETAHGTAPASFPDNALGSRLEAGYSFQGMKREIPDDSVKPDHGSDPSGPGTPEVTNSIPLKVGGIVTSPADGTIAPDTLLSFLLQSALGSDTAGAGDGRSAQWGSAVAAGTPTTSEVIQEAEDNEVKTDDFMILDLGGTQGVTARPVEDATALTTVPSILWPSAPVATDRIYATDNIYLRNVEGIHLPTVAAIFRGRSALDSKELYGLVHNFSLPQAARSEQQQIVFAGIGSSFVARTAEAPSTPSTQLPEASSVGELLLAPAGSAQTAEDFCVYNYGLEMNIVHDPLPPCSGAGDQDNSGYNFFANPILTVEVLQSSVPVGTGTDWLDIWDGGTATDNDFQFMAQHGKTLGRIFMWRAKSMIMIGPPVAGNQNGTATFILTFKILTGVTKPMTFALG